MACLEPFSFFDLLSFNTVNFDPLTETFTNDFYYRYLTHWPSYQVMSRDPNGFAQGYMIGKIEGTGEDWHAHVSAVTVAPDARRLGLGGQLMDMLERAAADVDNCYFVDLFMRKSNKAAAKMYEALGYQTYRTVLGYYSGDTPEDALDMRKALRRDQERSVSSLVSKERTILPHQLEWH
eukprot:TRINITY_DN43342_c0_g1_i1.p1 TRINITY_DN43342_c0_g1~~TRINITY_DN43342_c0_g1_i1.p1  ORF type:complete len:200 (+),score=58.77 TRINITY_DN43342_c0_g1_i1:66-602(+)